MSGIWLVDYLITVLKFQKSEIFSFNQMSDICETDRGRGLVQNPRHYTI